MARKVNTGNFVDQQSTTGPGPFAEVKHQFCFETVGCASRRQDSFFEYLLKGYILFHDFELLEIFLSAYASAPWRSTCF